MSRVPRVTGSDLVAALAKAGFAVIRIKGSHHFLRHQDGRVTVVETWDSLAHYQRYDRWRAETGFTDLFESLVAGEPSERHLEVIDS